MGLSSGWSMWFADFLFLERNWAKDELTLKGFVKAVTHTRTFIPVIYDCTFIVSKSEPSPMLRILKGIPYTVKVQVKRHKMEELLETPDGIAQWCRDTCVAKDALLEKYNTTDIFSELELQEIRRPKSSIMVILRGFFRNEQKFTII
ncbi:1-acyl-sn-glycerol-3-phosphate acyltransferase, putative [Medicago truncatula]|uniref:1-acylglycerol-3-phosphate O-acyltransferase n=1 Tax=Medicago truncatula TaxID=3880 RepID=A0A072U5Y2_MEDTR|nr:1-acyl-sn-glycerol-3-phosphate acyltransferase, putative [Medicago truncatula]